MKGACLILGLIALTGCATALKRDAECLARLTPGYLSAQQELTHISRFSQARTRHHQVLEWYPRVYERLATRLEEEQILSEVRWVLAGNPPSLIFYPIIRWNIHHGLWDGTDPDAGSDPVNQFCATQLAHDASSAEPTEVQTK